MADIRINALPLATGPTAPAPSDNVAIDGTSTRKSTLSGLADAIRPMASQAEAEAGSNAVNGMSPLTTAQAIVAQALVPSSIGTSVQAFSTNLTTLAGVASGATGRDILADSTVDDVYTSLTTAVWTSGVTKTMKDRAKYICHMSDFSIDLTGNNDDTTNVQAWLTQATSPGAAQAMRGKIAMGPTVVIPSGVTYFRGSGTKDEWGDGFAMPTTPAGTVFFAVGAGNASRWTDITGADAADDTPMFVFGANNIVMENVTVYGNSLRSIGILIPCVKQSTLRRVSGFGFTDGALYFDGTWSSRNTTLKALHPEINPSSGMNEATVDDCWFEGSGTNGFGIKIQGTTRAGNAVATEPEWLWGYGGVGSDVRINNTRLGSSAAQGGCYSHDAQLFGGDTDLGRGVVFNGVGFRSTGGSRYAMKFDRSDGHTFYGIYAEGGPTNEIAVTSRTQKGLQGNAMFGERMISGDITVDGVVVDTDTTRLWEATRCISFYKVDGDVRTPNFNGGKTTAFDDIPAVASFHSGDVLARYNWDDGTTRSEFFRLAKTFFRSQGDGTATLGDSTHRWSNTYTNAVTLGDNSIKIISGGVITVTGSLHRVDTEAGAATDDLDTINGGNDNMLLVLTTTANSKDVTLKDGTGNLILNGDFLMDTTSDTITLIKTSVGWKEIARSNNA